MTLEPYDPQRLDALALRVLDICTRLRAMARKGQQESLPPIDLHDRKALEWLDKFEEWALDAEAQMERATFKHRGQLRARQTKVPGSPS